LKLGAATLNVSERPATAGVFQYGHFGRQGMRSGPRRQPHGSERCADMTGPTAQQEQQGGNARHSTIRFDNSANFTLPLE
jgi:hypothetical protein